MSPPLRAIRLPLIVAVLVTGWIVWLRAPTFGVTLWNVDEGIEAVIGNGLREGRVMYRDFVDHRTPLSYYATAGLFSITGTSMTALHVMVAGLVSATACLLFMLARRTHGVFAGGFAAVIFAALACQLLTPSDAYAAHTEWFLILFTTSAGLLFCSTSGVPSFGRSLGVGLLIGLGFLSKQPGLVELGAPCGTLMYAMAMEAAPPRAVARAAAGILGGFAAVTGTVALLFVLSGGWADMAFYTWTYNTRYYGPETSWADRLHAPWPFFAELATQYPLVFAAGIAGASFLAFRLAQLRPAEAWRQSRTFECYALLWCGTSLAGAMAAGRSFDHYFIQCLPAFAWMAALLPSLLAGQVASRRTRLIRPAPLVMTAVLGLFSAWLVLRPLLGTRHIVPPPPDPALRLSDYIRTHTAPADKIFVWGYNADIYLYANRAPASRFVYCTFQTGLIPWTNLDPAKDTNYAVVPGSMKALLSDLERNPPAFIVDCGVGPHRRFQKYPLKKFPQLVSYVESRMVEIEPEIFHGHGFRLFMRRDSTLAGAPRPDGSDRHPSAQVTGPAVVGTGRFPYLVSVWQPERAEAERLALFLDDVEIAAVRFPPTKSISFEVPVAFDTTGMKKRRLHSVAFWSDGTKTKSPPLEVTVGDLDTSPALREAFALPRMTGAVAASGVRALFNPRVEQEGGQRTFALHAPSLVRYDLPAAATAVRGAFGIPAGAYAPDNKAPSDGAEFLVRVVAPDGGTQILLDRLLRPATEPEDRPVQSFRVDLPSHPAGASLELEIRPGPQGNPSSDWTFWSDVMLDTSP